MPRIPFSPPPGINSDDTTFAAEGRWADGNNVRFRMGRPQTIHGYDDPQQSDGTEIPITLTGTCRNIHYWAPVISATVKSTMVFGTSSKLQSFIGTTLRDITPVGFTSATHWQMDNYGDLLMAVPYAGTLYAWTPVEAATAATEVTQAPDKIYSVIVTASRQVMALGCNEETSGTFNPKCIRWTDIEDHTDWTTTATNNAGEHILEDEGEIIGRAKVGPYIAIWTTNSLYLAEYIGDPAQTFRFEKVGEQCGLVGPNAVVVVGSTAYWVGRHKRFWQWTPGTAPQQMVCPIWRDFNDNIAIGSGFLPNVIAGASPIYNEVWFFYEDTRDATSTNSRYVAYCIEESQLAQRPVWFRGQLARTAWLECTDSRFRSGVVGVDTAGKVLQHEVANDAEGAALAWHIQSADQYMEEGGRSFMVKRFVPDFEDQVGSVKLSLLTRQRPQGSAVTNGPYTIATSDTKKDLRVSGNIMAVKFEDADATNSYWRLGKPIFEAVRTGARR